MLARITLGADEVRQALERPLNRIVTALRELLEQTPEQLVSCIDFRYITGALTPDEALDLLRRQAPTKAQREAKMLKYGFPAYTSGAGWSR